MVCNTIIPCTTPLIFWWMVLFIVACHHPLSCCMSIFVWFLHTCISLLLLLYMYIAILCMHTGLLTYTSYDAYADVLHWCSCITCPDILCKWYMVFTCSTCRSAGKGGPYMKYSNLHVGQVKGHTYDIKFLPMNQIRLAHSQDNSLIGTPLSMFEPLRSCNHDTLPTSCVLILIIEAFLFQSVLILIVHCTCRCFYPY